MKQLAAAFLLSEHDHFSISPLEGDQTLLMRDSGAPGPVQREEIRVYHLSRGVSPLAHSTEVARHRGTNSGQDLPIRLRRGLERDLTRSVGSSCSKE